MRRVLSVLSHGLQLKIMEFNKNKYELLHLAPKPVAQERKFRNNTWNVEAVWII